MYVCVYIYIYNKLCACVYVHIHDARHGGRDGCIRTDGYIHSYTHTHTDAFSGAHAMLSGSFACTHTFIHTYNYQHTHTFMYFQVLMQCLSGSYECSPGRRFLCPILHRGLWHSRGTEGHADDKGTWFCPGMCMYVCFCMYVTSFYVCNVCSNWFRQSMNMHVCMHVCMSCMQYLISSGFVHACMHACMHVSKDEWRPVWKFNCVHECVYVCMYISMYACKYVCMYVCRILLVCCVLNVEMHARVYLRVNIHSTHIICNSVHSYACA